MQSLQSNESAQAAPERTAEEVPSEQAMWSITDTRPTRLRGLKRFRLILLVPVSLLLVALAKRYPAAVERIYAQRVYPALRDLFGRLFSLFPFSVAELLVILLPAALLVYITRQIVLAVRRPAQRRGRIVRLTANLCCIAGVGYFLFLLLCGFNYYRESFTVRSGLEVRPSSAEELAALCGELTGQANLLRGQVTEDEYGVMTSSFESYRETTAAARAAYESAAGQYPDLGGYTVRPKPVLASWAMSYLDISGIYMPYTFEANVNVDVPAYGIPSSMMHELAHSKGFMREDEANFLSYLACMAGDSADFAYSGTVLALIHSTNALHDADPELYREVREQFSDGVNRDLKAGSAYWKQFEGPVAEVSAAVNDVYLRSNHQTEGVKSYGRMVDLLLADYRQRHDLT